MSASAARTVARRPANGGNHAVVRDNGTVFAREGAFVVSGSVQSGGVLCIGAVMVDVVCRVPRLPARGEGVIATERTQTLGGCAFNSGCAVRELGAPCFLLAPLGTGPTADFIRAGLAARGLAALEIDTTFDCGVCTCLVEPDGERTMITAPGIERRFERSWFERIDGERFAAAVASGYEIEGAGGGEIISFVERHPDLEFYYAPGPRIMGVDSEKNARINALHPVWHLNDQEALEFTGAATVDEAGRTIATACENACVITCGVQGAAAYLADGAVIKVPTEPVEVVDTVGAGDAHVGALAAARAAGAPWDEALAVANAVAGVACTVAGGALPAGALASAGVHL